MLDAPGPKLQQVTTSEETDAAAAPQAPALAAAATAPGGGSSNLSVADIAKISQAAVLIAQSAGGLAPLLCNPATAQQHPTTSGRIACEHRQTNAKGSRKQIGVVSKAQRNRAVQGAPSRMQRHKPQQQPVKRRPAWDDDFASSGTPPGMSDAKKDGSSSDAAQAVARPRSQAHSRPGGAAGRLAVASGATPAPAEAAIGHPSHSFAAARPTGRGQVNSANSHAACRQPGAAGSRVSSTPPAGGRPSGGTGGQAVLTKLQSFGAQGNFCSRSSYNLHLLHHE